MKQLFAVALAALVLAALGTWYSFPEQQAGVPVIYWVTDPNPARVDQVKLFHEWVRSWACPRPDGADPEALRKWQEGEVYRKWLVDHGYSDERWTGEYEYPVVQLQVDSANVQGDKILIQGVSGVLGDIVGHTGGPNMRFRQDVGFLMDLTDDAERLGFGLDKTWEAVRPDLTVDGRQYAFPCNVSARPLWVNVDMFRAVGMEPPPVRWTFDDFERIGVEFLRRYAEQFPGKRVWLLHRVDPLFMYRNQGLSKFNETLTRCTLDDERMARALELEYRWMNTLHLLPSAADYASVTIESDYAGPPGALFCNDQIAMVYFGRYFLIKTRGETRKLLMQRDKARTELAEAKAAGTGAEAVKALEEKLVELMARRLHIELKVVELPHDGYPTVPASTRAAAVYLRSEHEALAKLFLAYLAGPEYNMQIVRDADALPPNPAATRTEAFRKPAEYPNEWGSHETFAELMQTLAIADSSSPYVLDVEVTRIIEDERQKYLNDRIAPAGSIEAARQAATHIATAINREIRRSLEENPKLKPRYDRMVELQKKIDALRARGELVPLSWIANPFHRKYYMDKKWADPDA